MILITSAAYIGQDFKAEFGMLPPCMLPIGNRRLYQHQIKVLHSAFPEQTLYVSLPESFVLDEIDQRQLEEMSVNIINVPDDLSLSESLLYVINSAGRYEESLHILHGDTLILDLPSGTDKISVSKPKFDYNWEVEAKNGEQELVWSGFFSFADVKLLARAITRARTDFARAIREYDAIRPLSRVLTNQWLDLGHVSSYYASRAKITTERHFNSLHVAEGCITKSSKDSHKLRAEANWYRSVPPPIRRFCPQLLGECDQDQAYSYSLEYLYLTPLNELYVHGRNPPFFWEIIFSKLSDFLSICRKEFKKANELENNKATSKVTARSRKLFGEKTFERLELFSAATGIALDKENKINGHHAPSLSTIAEKCIEMVSSLPVYSGIMHGDLCFSNILFDGRAVNIKVIDPRGLDDAGEFTIHGDLRYDFSKLMHSVIGMYDFIISGAYQINIRSYHDTELIIFSDTRISEIQNHFTQLNFLSDGTKAIDHIPHVILLFLSMLPLHADSQQRQIALMANALRMFSLLEGSV